jgi:hypothetical protein
VKKEVIGLAWEAMLGLPWAFSYNLGERSPLSFLPRTSWLIFEAKTQDLENFLWRFCFQI